MCRVNQKVVTGIKKFLSCLVFKLFFCVKGVDSFNKVAARCGILDILEDIWGVL